MIHSEVNGISLYRFESLESLNIGHAFFARKGGVSPKPWESLNQANMEGEPREHIIENRRRSFEAIERPVETIFDVWQVHGTNVICTDAPRPLEEPHKKADAIFTNNPDVTLFMRFADCVPILLYEPKKQVVGIVHAGWMGTVQKVISVAIQTAQQKYGIDPQNLCAGIGPSIGRDHYQVGTDVINAVKNSFSQTYARLIEDRDGKTYFDLWMANKLLLEESGVKQIQTAEICTACHTEEWFSHRAEKGNTGRFAAAIYLK